MKREMFADPEPFDEDDPVQKQEQFLYYKAAGLKPEDLPGASESFRREYRQFLQQQ
jgi:hypothetical protein